MMITAFLLQAALPTGPTVTLLEARTMSPSALAARLLPELKHGPIVDVIINGRGGLTPSSQSVVRVWLIEQMVPFDATTCRSHVFNVEMKSSDPAAKPRLTPLPTHPAEVEQYDRLWVPPVGKATTVSCAGAPAKASGFGVGGLGLREVADLVEQARTAFARAPRARKFTVSCKGERGACGIDSRKTLAAIDWSSLGFVEQVSPKGKPYYVGDQKPDAAASGPSHV
jgi:hypothetical protein